MKSLKHLVRIASFLYASATISLPLAGISACLIPVTFCVAASRGARIERVQDALQEQEEHMEAVLQESITSTAQRKVRTAADANALRDERVALTEDEGKRGREYGGVLSSRLHVAGARDH